MNIGNEFLQERKNTIDFLLSLGVPVIPVAPAFSAEQYSQKGRDGTIRTKDGQPIPAFCGKNPSWVDHNGIPHLLAHTPYQTQLPQEEEVRKWFYSPLTGVGTMTGWCNYYPIDLDLKHFPSQEDCDKAAFDILEKVGNTWWERTHSGGHRIVVELPQPPGFTNFALTPGGKHVGEVLGHGRFTVLAPTIGPSGNSYTVMHRCKPARVENLADIGIYPVSSKTATNTTPATIRQPSYIPGALRLEDLSSDRARRILQGDIEGEDRSTALTQAINEWYGWENFCNRNLISYSGTTADLAAFAWSQFPEHEYDPDKWQRILKTVDPAKCVTSAEYRSGDEVSCWKKIHKQSPHTYNERCPQHIKDRIAAEYGFTQTTTQQPLPSKGGEDKKKQKEEPTLSELVAAIDKIDQECGFGTPEYDYRILRLSSAARIKRADLLGLYQRVKRPNNEFSTLTGEQLKASAEARDGQDFIFADLLPFGWTTVFFAAGGTGKSLIAYQMAIAAASGGKFLRYQATTPVKTLFIQIDEPRNLLEDRVRSNERFCHPNLFYKVSFQPSDLPRLKQEIINEGYRFIILDSLAAFQSRSGIAEKDAEFGHVLYQLRDIAAETNCTFLILHHTNKLGEFRGHTSIKDNVSALWELRRFNSDRDPVKLTATERVLEIGTLKNRGANQIAELLLDFSEDEETFVLKGDYQKLKHPNQPATWSEKILELFETRPDIHITPAELCGMTIMEGLKPDTARKTLLKLCRRGLIRKCGQRRPESGGHEEPIYCHIKNKASRPLDPSTAESNSETVLDREDTQRVTQEDIQNLTPDQRDTPKLDETTSKDRPVDNPFTVPSDKSLPSNDLDISKEQGDSLPSDLVDRFLPKEKKDKSHKPINPYSGPQEGQRVRFVANDLSEGDIRKMRRKGQELPWGAEGVVVETDYCTKNYSITVQTDAGMRFAVDNLLAVEIIQE